ncbi:sulfatase-like hydrolase/transferase [Psychroserpens sp. XS_ASV72]|uniref:sulfatase-like hydrolase/transferase n=1 Tax=Psychroserpens sp. XS_ASV72 TaxID=3241293 RepID=UPI0035167414
MIRDKIAKFISSNREYPVLFGLATGIQPLLYLYDSNFNMVNSWPQFLFLASFFIAIPIAVFLLLSFLLKVLKASANFKSKMFSVLNFCLFTFFVGYVTFGIQKRLLLITLLVAVCILAIIFYKHLKKVVVFQLLLAVLVLVKLTPSLYYFVQYSYEWQEPKDDIKNVVFKKRPNIYYLQPDGYVDFNILTSGYYAFEDMGMETFLEDNGFRIYNDFRSNYTSTLTSNSSMFSMKHHYYYAYLNSDRFYNSRQIITGKNPVIDIFKNNDYHTNLILDAPYLVTNRPNILYDYCNLDYDEIAYLPRGFEFEKDTKEALFKAMENKVGSKSSFYFVRQPYPGHIQTRPTESKGKEEERSAYLQDLKTSNEWLRIVIREINQKDPNSIIVISSDHGGYVGYDYMRESYIKTTDEDLIQSTFSSLLAVKWPTQEVPDYENTLKSSVNLFRVLFAYLAEEDHYLQNLEPDISYGRIRQQAPEGVYELINEKGEVVFNKISK